MLVCSALTQTMSRIRSSAALGTFLLLFIISFLQREHTDEEGGKSVQNKTKMKSFSTYPTQSSLYFEPEPACWALAEKESDENIKLDGKFIDFFRKMGRTFFVCWVFHSFHIKKRGNTLPSFVCHYSALKSSSTASCCKLARSNFECSKREKMRERKKGFYGLLFCHVPLIHAYELITNCLKYECVYTTR